jgi:hypothetical protein
LVALASVTLAEKEKVTALELLRVWAEIRSRALAPRGANGKQAAKGGVKKGFIS